MYALVLCVALIVTPQDPINKHVTAHNETKTAAPKTKNKPLPAVSVNTPSNQPNSSSYSDQHNTTPDNRVNRIEVVPQADWWFKGYVIATLAIAAANIAVLITIWRQKVVMSAQLVVMEKQVHNAAEQVFAAQGTNHRISFQINLMQQANEQTKRLIEETRISADAAKASANALVQSERAWINARLKFEGSLDHYSLEIANYGRTMGHILQIRFGTNCIEPNTRPMEPYGDTVGLPINTLILPDTEWRPLEDFRRITDYFDPHWRDVQIGTTQAIFFFYVVYKDVLGEEHKSRFVYGYRIPTSRFEEFRECREYT